MQKRGQITIFIILGIVIVALFSLLFLIISKTTTELETQEPLLFGPIQTFIDSCFQRTLDDGLIETGLHGGYYVVPSLPTESYYSTPYYFYINKDISPSKEEIEEQLALYINGNLNSCLNNFSYFEEKGVLIEEGEMNSEILITDTKVRADMYFPLTIKLGKRTKEISRFTAESKVKLGRIFDFVKDLSRRQTENNALLHNSLVNFSLHHNFHYTILDQTEGSYIYTIEDNNTVINKRPYRFTFTMKYEWDDLEQKVWLFPIPDQEASVGVHFNYQLQSFGEDLHYSSDTDLFDISDKGEI